MRTEKRNVRQKALLVAALSMLFGALPAPATAGPPGSECPDPNDPNMRVICATVCWLSREWCIEDKKPDPDPPQQVAEGQVMLPSAAKCGTHAYADAVVHSVTGVDNAFSFRFKVDRATRGQPFILSTNDPAADMDIAFRGKRHVVFERRVIGGEAGNVPRGATRAAVCIYSGAGARFTYQAMG